MASSRRDSMSRAYLHAGSKNAHCKSELQHELDVLDKERDHLLQSLRNEAKQFKQQFPNYSTPPGTRPSTATKDKLGSESHRPSVDSCGTPKSPRASPRPSHKTPSSAAGNRSPRPLHKSASLQSEHVLVTEMAAARSADHASGDHGGVPQIVVSDATDQQQGKRPAATPKRRGSKQGASSPSTARSGSGSDSERSSPLSQSLNLPSYRARCDSMPSGMGLNSNHPARRLSHSPAPPPATDLRVPENLRGRSSSFSSIQPARKRGSIVEQWGSISERNRPTMGSFKGRRGSVDMENLLRDLSFGVQHSELMALKDQKSSVSDKQWEELKKCRYLRIPSRDNSEEDISQD